MATRNVLYVVTVTFRNGEKLLLNFSNVKAARDFCYGPAIFKYKDITDITGEWHGYSMHSDAESAMTTLQHFMGV